MLSPDDFRQQDYLTEITVDLNNSNVLKVELRSKPDTYLTIEVIQDYPPPTVTISAEPDAIKVDETSTLSWNSEYADTCVIEPDIGSVDVNGSITVSPNETTFYVITATGPGGTASDSTTITHVNSAPVAENQSVITDEDIEVLIHLVASDPDKDPLTYELLGGPSHGILTGEAPDLTCSPQENYNGSDLFTFKVNDGFEDSGFATVNILINPVNDPPSISGSPEPIVNAGETYNFTPVVYDPDLEETFIFSIENKPTWANFDTKTGCLSGSPGIDDTGTTYHIVITVIDSKLASDTLQPFDITVVSLNDAPIITVIEPDGIDDLTDCRFVIGWTDNDPDDDAVISLFYDTDNLGNDGTLIISGLREDPDGPGDQYEWDTSNIPDGEYYIYAEIDDGVNEPVADYSKDMVTIAHVTLDEYKITAFDGSSGDYFGYPVMIKGDYAFVGSRYDDDKGTDSGSVYIYKRDGDSWIYMNKLTAPDGSAYDYFGKSVSIDEDYAIISAYQDDDKGKDSGSAYIFKREGDTWNEIIKLTASDGAAYDYFGSYVSISGDYAIVGAYRDADKGSFSGSAYIFMRNGDTWIEVCKLTASDGASFDYFGNSVSIDGDYAIVSVHGKNSLKGAAYIYKQYGGFWNQVAKITASDGSSGDFFGSNVSISGDYIIVGSHMDNAKGSDSGSAYIFKRDGDAWIETAKLIASDGAAGDYFGVYVSIDDDYAMVGAYNDDDKGSDSGSAYIFKRDGDSWKEVTKLTASDGATGDYFGYSVSINNEYAMAGAWNDDNGSDSGSAYIYSLSLGDISAFPETISTGETSELSWNFPDSMFVSIDNGIGEVPAEGTMTVAPYETTTYNITAESCVGTFSDSVTITVSPTGNLKADPSEIAIGNSSILSWNFVDASMVEIDNGIGEVPASGVITLSPEETTTYTITSIGPWGVYTESITVVVIPIGISITYPLNNNLIQRPDVMVEGAIINPYGLEVGVSVNGVIALVEGNQFVANHVPLDGGVNSISATVVDWEDNTSTDSINVYANISGEYIRLTSDIESGISPLEATLNIEGSFNISEAEITYTGPGEVVFFEDPEENEYTASITTEGLYFITAEVEHEGEI